MSDQRKITGIWLSPDRTNIVIQLDGDQLTLIEPDDPAPLNLFGIPDDYSTLTTETQDWP